MHQRVSDRPKTIYWILMAYVATWLIAPILQYGTVYRVMAIVAIFLVAICTLPRGWRRIEYITIFFIIIYMMAVGLLTRVLFTRHMGMYIFVSCSLFTLYFQVYDEPWKYGSIIILAYLVCIAFNITTIRALAVDAQVMRFLVRNSDMSAELSRRGIGGYGYCYAVLCMIPLAIGDFLKRGNRTRRKAIAAVFLLTAYLMIFQSGYFMAMLLSMLCIPLYFVLQIKDKGKRLLYIALLLVLTIIALGSVEQIGQTLIDSTDNVKIQRKISEIVNLTVDDSASLDKGEFSLRYQRYTKDFRLMLDSPVWGTWGLNNGNHSHILDFFASYGLILGAAYIFSVKRILKSMNLYYSPAAQTSVLIMLMVLMMNTLAPSFGLVLFIMVPIYSAIDANEGYL